MREAETRYTDRVSDLNHTGVIYNVPRQHETLVR